MNKVVNKNNELIQNKPKIISIYSGIDILGLGFSKLFDIVMAVEIENKACETLNANKEKYHPNMQVINKDVLTVSDEFIQENKFIDGIIGGAPCQPFSAARGKFDPNDKRIACLFDYLRWVKLIKPKFFVMENTEGLTQSSKIEILKSFVFKAEQLGYRVKHQVLNAHDYGNVQKRKRVIIVGIRNDLIGCEYDFPKHVEDSKKKYVKDIIFPGEEVGECAKYSSERARIMAHVPQGGNWRSLSEELQKEAMKGNFEKRAGGMSGAYKRLSLENGFVCPTLVTSPVQRNTMCCHPLEDRPLSIKEYCRGQGIPEDYKIIGSTAEKYRFVGNAVPYELAEAIAKSIYSCLKNAFV